MQEERRQQDESALKRARAKLEREFALRQDEAQRQAIESWLDRNALELEAERTGVSPDDQLARLSGQPVTRADLLEFYVAEQQSIGQPFALVETRLRDLLERRNADAARRAYLDRLRQRYRAEDLSEPLRVPVAATGPASGRADAPVTIVEFSDFMCPFCARLAPTLKKIREHFGDRVRLVYRHFPILELHPEAQLAAEASMCADSQGKFWAMHDALFSGPSRFDLPSLMERAARAGLDVERFVKCLENREFRDVVDRDAAAARELFLDSTPSVFVNGRLIAGAASFEEIARLVEDELRRAARAAKLSSPAT